MFTRNKRKYTEIDTIDSKKEKTTTKSKKVCDSVDYDSVGEGKGDAEEKGDNDKAHLMINNTESKKEEISTSKSKNGCSSENPECKNEKEKKFLSKSKQNWNGKLVSIL